MVLLAFSYFGPKEEAEAFFEEKIPKDALAQAVNVTTGAADFAKINDPYAAMSRHGGFKEFEGGFLEEVDEEGLIKAFEIFLKYTEPSWSRAGSNFLISCWSPAKVGEMADHSPRSFFPSKDRAFFTQAVPWYETQEEREEAIQFARGVYDALSAKDTSQGRRKWGFVNNVHIESDMREVFSDAQIEEIVHVKSVFDKHALGWSPVADGWSIDMSVQEPS